MTIIRHRRSIRDLDHSRLAATVATLALAVLASSPSADAQDYRSHAEIGTFVQAAQAAHPNICKWYNVGNSHLGRELWALRISDNVNLYADEDEPEFKYTSSMHGDEIIGVEMCLHLIDYLLINYGSDTQVDRIVNEVDLWILPLMNPDGYEASPRTRYNSVGVDLNRDFPDLYDPNTPWATETQVIMNWVAQHTFTASANLHGGVVVVNYPYDNEDSGSRWTPDDAEFIWMSEEYSRHNTGMWDSTSFFHGITNGVDWYTVHGSMQDWNYHFMGCNDVVVELSNSKQPTATSIPGFWDANRDSMLAYIETCLTGARGIVSDMDTTDPLSATVTVVGRNHDIYTDPDIGDYHRILRPGSYDLRFESLGYDTIVVPGVGVLEGDATRRDIGMTAPPAVTSPDGGEVLEKGVPTTVTWTGHPSAQFHLRYTANADDTTAVDDGFERALLGDDYDTGGERPWITTTGTSNSGVRSARSGSLSDDNQSWMTRTVSGGDLSFWYRVSSEAGYDFFNFLIDGAGVLHESGNVGWTLYATTLPTGSYELKWQYSKDFGYASGNDTVWIDDLQFTQDNTAWTDIVTLTEVGAMSAEWTPNGEGSDYKVAVRAYYGDAVYGEWDESTDRFTVQAFAPIPAVSTWGMVVMVLCTLLSGTVVLRRRRATPRPSVAAHWRAPMPGCKALGATLILLSALGFSGTPALAGEIHTAARLGDVASMHRLIDAGADVNGKNARGAAPIHIVALFGGRSEEDSARRGELTALLIEAGADLGLGDAQGKTALHLAIARTRPKMVAQLLAAKADVNAADAMGRTPLHQAALADHAPTVKRVLARKGDPKLTDHEGNTPLHLAAMRFRHRAVRLLLAAEANVDTKNAKGATPLIVAAASGPRGVKEIDRLVTDVATILIGAGADCNAVDATGGTPLSYAAANSRDKLAKLLRDSGARR